MTIRFARFAVLVLLAVAVPIQGVAAVAASQCMAFGHHQDAGGQDHQHHAHDEGTDPHDHGAQKIADEGHNGHCGPCTACCASASIAAPSLPSLLPSASNTKYVLSQLAPPGVEPQRFDRPPLAL